MTWPEVALGDLFEITRGGSPRPIHAYLTDADDGVNWVSISDATESDKYIRHTKRKIKPSGVSRSRPVKPGDFLLTNSMSFGRPYVMATHGCIHDGWLCLAPRSGRTDPNYLFEVLRSPLIYGRFQRLASGATVKNLNIDLVSGVSIPLPPLDEQRRIAAILDQADRLLQLRTRSISMLVALRAAFLERTIEMSPCIRVKLGHLVDEFRYGTSEKAGGAGSPVLRIPNVVGDAIVLDDLKQVHLSEAEFQRLALQTNDLLFVRTNGNRDYVARSALVAANLGHDLGLAPPNFVYASYLIRARLRHGTANPTYLQAFLSSPKGRQSALAQAKTSAGQFNINVEGLGAIEVQLPRREVQNDFARFCEATAGQAALLQRHVMSLRSLFASLQDRAFNGQLIAKTAERELAEAF